MTAFSSTVAMSNAVQNNPSAFSAIYIGSPKTLTEYREIGDAVALYRTAYPSELSLYINRHPNPSDNFVVLTAKDHAPAIAILPNGIDGDTERLLTYANNNNIRIFNKRTIESGFDLIRFSILFSLSLLLFFTFVLACKLLIDSYFERCLQSIDVIHQCKQNLNGFIDKF